MKNFIGKYSYIIYFIIMICIFTNKIVIIGPLILEYLIRLSEKSENFIEEYAWAFFMGAITGIYGLYINDYRYWVVDVISIILVGIRKGDYK